ncbi:hypothetical protein Z951_45845 [Streptomyces sp. PRh5]|nr:hypothetical protein Z951_45845 [Streptomyces sp. PRh5]
MNKLGSLPVILSGPDAAGMKTKAVRDGDHWVLNGVKRWIANAGVSGARGRRRRLWTPGQVVGLRFSISCRSAIWVNRSHPW